MKKVLIVCDKEKIKDSIEQILRTSKVENFLVVSRAREISEMVSFDFDLVILHVSNEDLGSFLPLRLFLGSCYKDANVCKAWNINPEHKYYKYYQIGQRHQGKQVFLISGGTKEFIKEVLSDCQIKVDENIHLQGEIETSYKALLQTKIVPYLKEEIDDLKAGKVSYEEYMLGILMKCREPEGFDETEEIFEQFKALYPGQSKLEEKVIKVYNNEFLNLRKKFPEPKQTDVFSPEYLEALTNLKNSIFTASKEITTMLEQERILRTFKHDLNNLFGPVLLQLKDINQDTEENKKEEMKILIQIVRQNWKDEKGNLIELKQKEFRTVCERLSQLGFNVEAKCADEVKAVQDALNIILRNAGYFHLDIDELQLTPSDVEQITSHTDEMLQALNMILTGLAQMVSKLTSVKGA